QILSFEWRRLVVSLEWFAVSVDESRKRARFARLRRNRHAIHADFLRQLKTPFQRLWNFDSTPRQKRQSAHHRTRFVRPHLFHHRRRCPRSQFRLHEHYVHHARHQRDRFHRHSRYVHLRFLRTPLERHLPRFLPAQFRLRQWKPHLLRHRRPKQSHR